MGSNRESSEFTDNVNALLALFIDISAVLVKSGFIVYKEFKILKAVNLLNGFTLDGGGAQSRAGSCR